MNVVSSSGFWHFLIGSKETVKVKAEHLAQLMAEELRPFRQFKDDDRAVGALKNFFATPLLARASQTGVLFALQDKGACRAVVLQGMHIPSHVGYQVESINIHFRPGDMTASKWVKERLLELSFAKDLRQLLTLSGCHTQLLPTLERIGLGIDALGLLGDTSASLNALLEAKNPPSDFKQAGLDCVPMVPNHLEAVVALRGRTFKADPEYCWFGAAETHLAAYEKKMRESLEREHLWWVLLEGERVVGTFGSDMAIENPLWGPRGGLEILFEPEYRGRGLMKTAYRMMLEGMQSKNLPVYIGATAQLPVMALGKIMGRQMHKIHLYSNPVFGLEHFQMYLPDGF